VYDDPVLRVPILSVRLGNELSDPPRFQYLASDSDSFAEYVRVRANRNDAFYKVPAGGIDVCNVQVPIRRVPAP
jgi:peptidylprolyl isomerase